MKIHVKHCMEPSSKAVRFEAGVGDVVLLANGNCSYVEATIRSVKSDDTVVVTVLEGTHEVEREISVSTIHALIVGN